MEGKPTIAWKTIPKDCFRDNGQHKFNNMVQVHLLCVLAWERSRLCLLDQLCKDILAGDLYRNANHQSLSLKIKQ